MGFKGDILFYGKASRSLNAVKLLIDSYCKEFELGLTLCGDRSWLVAIDTSKSRLKLVEKLRKKSIQTGKTGAAFANFQYLLEVPRHPAFLLNDVSAMSQIAIRVR